MNFFPVLFKDKIDLSLHALHFKRYEMTCKDVICKSFLILVYERYNVQLICIMLLGSGGGLGPLCYDMVIMTVQFKISFSLLYIFIDAVSIPDEAQSLNKLAWGAMAHLSADSGAGYAEFNIAPSYLSHWH